jgi:serine acetyltransferase
MSKTTLLDANYQTKKRELLTLLIAHLRPTYTDEEIDALRIDAIDPQILAQRSGRGFVNRDLVETLLGNLLECVAPGSHNAVGPEHEKGDLNASMGQVADQLYAMVAQSLLAAGEDEGVEEQALASSFALLWDLPRLKLRARWNRFAALRDPAVWDAYLLHNCGIAREDLLRIDFTGQLEESIRRRDFEYYRQFLKDLECDFIFDYQMQLVMSTYPGWRILFYHDVAHALTRSDAVANDPGLARQPVPLLPRAISELAGRYYQADLHPETQIGDANFLDHPHRGMTTGQTGIIGSGCHMYPCTLGGLSDKVQQRHPVIGDFVFVGTDAGLFGPVQVGDHSVIGANSEIHGYVEIGSHCRVGASVFIGTIKDGRARPGRVELGEGVRVGAGTIIENASELDLVIPPRAEIPARSYVVNNGCGQPRFVLE